MIGCALGCLSMNPVNNFQRDPPMPFIKSMQQPLTQNSLVFGCFSPAAASVSAHFIPAQRMTHKSRCELAKRDSMASLLLPDSKSCCLNENARQNPFARAWGVHAYQHVRENAQD